MKTVDVVQRLVSNRKYRWMIAGITAGYLFLFLAALQDLTFGGGGGIQVQVAQLSAMFRRTGMFIFDAVAIVETPVATLLVSPLNILTGLLISFLVGLNLTMTYVAFRQPTVCTVNRSTGILGVFPALLAGGACCGPAILFIFGIQATAAFITVAQLLIPIAFLLLLGSLVLIARRTELEKL